jgi:hypothetical protein
LVPGGSSGRKGDVIFPIFFFREVFVAELRLHIRLCFGHTSLSEHNKFVQLDIKVPNKLTHFVLESCASLSQLWQVSIFLSF